MSTYVTKCWSEKYEMEGNFSDAASPIYLNGEPTGKQVADFRHSSEDAMRYFLEETVRASGDDPEDEEISDKIDAAIEAMV